jgi:KDO2-lipid IV(A) lauroyltransferase
MQKILFYIFYGLTWLIAQIPLVVIHWISDFVFFCVYYIFGYRRKVVRGNLTKSFPQKSDDEIRKIEIKYYRHLCDLFFENFLLLHASKEKAMKQCEFNNLDIFDKLYADGKSGVLVAAHYGNWELFGLMSQFINHKFLGVYKPLKDKNFDLLLNNTRKRFGAEPVPMQDTLRAIINCNQEKSPFLVFLISDQTPAAKDIQYWSTFLNQDTPVFLGVEKISQKFDLPIFYCQMIKVKRGRYEVNFVPLTDEPKKKKPFEITESHLRALEEQITETPEYWLWSHRRWKRKRKKSN